MKKLFKQQSFQSNNNNIKFIKQIKKVFSSQENKSNNENNMKSLSKNIENTKLSFLNDNYSRHEFIKTGKIPMIDSLGTAKQVIDDFTGNILPNIETFVEKKLLEEFSTQLTPKEKEAAYDAYGLRREKANKVMKDLDNKKREDLDEDNMLDKIDLSNLYTCVDGFSLSKMSISDIGKYYIIPEEVRITTFPFQFFGVEYQKEYAKTEAAAFMFREESFLLREVFKQVKTQSERIPIIEMTISRLILEENLDLPAILTYNFDIYSALYQEISNLLLDFINVFPDERMRMLFLANDLFDGLVAQLISNFNDKKFALCFLGFKESRKDLIKDIMMTYFANFVPAVKLVKSDLDELDHRISEKDLMCFKYYYQVKEKVPYIDIKFDKEKIRNDIEALLNHLEINNNQFTDILQAEKYSETRLIMNKDKLICIDIEPQVFRDKEEVEKENQLKEYRERRSALKKKLITEYKPLYNLTPLEIYNLNHNHTKYSGFNSGILLYGEAGCGKSCVLSYLHSWAKENNWFSVPVFKASNFFSKVNEDLEPHANGLFITEKAAKEFLLEMKVINLEILVKTTYLPEFGTINFAGEKDGAYEAFPTLWDEQREIFTDAWKQFPFAKSIDDIARHSPDQAQRISDFLPNPKNLLDIANFGLDNPRFATNAIAEILHNVKLNKEIKTMILIDEYNEFFKPTNFVSFRFANEYKLKIPPYALALVKLLINFDGHLLYNGVKVCATSTGKLYKHECDAKKLNFPEAYSMKVKNLALGEFRNAMHHLGVCKRANWTQTSEYQIKKNYTMTQGNFKELFEAAQFPYEIISPSIFKFLKRKAYNKTLRPKDENSIAVSKKKKIEQELRRQDRIEKTRKGYINNDYYI